MATQVESSHVEGSHSKQPEIEVGKANTRGKTRGVKWKRKRDDKFEPVVVDMPECLLRVVGDNAQQFITETSYIVKQYCPLNVNKWSDINLSIRKKLMDKVKEMFVLPKSANVERAVWRVLMKRYRSWRFGLRRDYYLKYKTDSERLSHCPPGVDYNEWKWLVEQYWGTQKFRHISEVNSSNLKKQKMLACVGTKSIARIAHEMRSTTSILENTAEPTEYLRLFAKERKKKDGSWVDKEAEEAYEKLRELHETQLQCNEVDTLTTQEAFTIVLGHRSGHQRGMGEGPLPFKSANHGGQQNHYSVTNEEITTRIQSEVEEKVANFCLKKEVELRAEIESKLREELRIEMKKELQRLVKEELASSRESHHPPSGSSISKPVDEKKSVSNDVAPTQCDIEFYTCSICNIAVKGAQEYMFHMRGEQHQKALNGAVVGSTPTTNL